MCNDKTDLKNLTTNPHCLDSVISDRQNSKSILGYSSGFPNGADFAFD